MPSNYEPPVSKNARYAVSLINFAIGRLRKDTFVVNYLVGKEQLYARSQNCEK